MALDAKGFVRTGADVAEGRQALETSRDGVFAIGDVRAGSTKRVAAAVGEGAQVIATVHAFLGDAGERGGVSPIMEGLTARRHGELAASDRLPARRSGERGSGRPEAMACPEASGISGHSPLVHHMPKRGDPALHLRQSEKHVHRVDERRGAGVRRIQG